MAVFPLATLAAVAIGAQPLSLPVRTDIPAGFSTKLCPTRAAAERMLSDFYAPGNPANNLIDIPLFMRGLGETGCAQMSGPITIQEVVARRTIDLGFSAETHIAYRGSRPDGSEVWGIVDEEWNNRLPRTPLEAFEQQFTNAGWLPSRAAWAGQAARILVCPSPQQARAVVAAMADPGSSSEARQRRAFERAGRAQRCAPAAAGARYRVTALLEAQWIGCGHECTTNWTALAARAADGGTVGLLHAYDEW